MGRALHAILPRRSGPPFLSYDEDVRCYVVAPACRLSGRVPFLVVRLGSKQRYPLVLTGAGERLQSRPDLIATCSESIEPFIITTLDGCGILEAPMNSLGVSTK